MNNQLNIKKMKSFNCKTMRKTVIVLFVAMTMISCNKENNTIEGRITKAMKEYAKNKFDNPKDLKEIVTIELCDTIDAVSVARNTLEMSQKLDSTCKVMNDTADLLSERMSEKLNRKKGDLGLTYEKRMYILSSINELADGIYEDLLNKGIRRTLFSEIDSLSKNEVFYPVRLYDINVRVNQDGQLKLKAFHTWICDTTSVIKIYENEVPKTIFQKETNMLEKCKELMTYDTKLLQFAEKRINLTREFIFYLE